MNTIKTIFSYIKIILFSVLLLFFYMISALTRIVDELLILLIEVPRIIAIVLVLLGIMVGIFTSLNLPTTFDAITNALAWSICFALFAGLLYLIINFLGSAIFLLVSAFLTLLSFERIIATCYVIVNSAADDFTAPQFAKLAKPLRLLLFLPLCIAAHIGILFDKLLAILQYAIYPAALAVVAYFIYQEAKPEGLSYFAVGSVPEGIALAFVFIVVLVTTCYLASLISISFRNVRTYFSTLYSDYFSEPLRATWNYFWRMNTAQDADTERQRHASQADSEPFDINLSMFAGVKDLSELRKKYLALIREYHPDRNPDMPDATEKTAQIIAEYQQCKQYFESPK